MMTIRQRLAEPGEKADLVFAVRAGKIEADATGSAELQPAARQMVVQTSR